MDLVQYAGAFPSAQAILLDAFVDGYGGGGKVFDWSLIPAELENADCSLGRARCGQRRRRHHPRRPAAVDVSSGVEVSDAAKGIKDAEKIRAFVAAVRAAGKMATD